MRKLRDVTIEEVAALAAIALLTGDFEAWWLLQVIARDKLGVSNRKWLQAVAEASFDAGYQFRQEEEQEAA